jgi:hypothetical protein
MNSHPPSNRLLLSLPPRDLKELAPKLEFIRCEPEQILLDVDALLDHVFFPNSGVISAVADARRFVIVFSAGKLTHYPAFGVRDDGFAVDLDFV